MTAVLTPAVVEFRTTIIDAIAGPMPRSGEWLFTDRFWYVDRDVVVGVCPVCDGSIGVTFAGTAPRADLRCHRGCNELDVAAAIASKGPRR